jgi:hypothetical protein
VASFLQALIAWLIILNTTINSFGLSEKHKLCQGYSTTIKYDNSDGCGNWQVNIFLGRPLKLENLRSDFSQNFEIM